jgi:hypothetical protein
MAPRIIVGLLAASIAISAPALAGSPQPTPLVPEAVSTDAPSLYVMGGLGPGGGGTDRFQASGPTFAFEFGGSIPIKGKAYIDLGMGLSIAGYKDVWPVYSWTDEPLLTTFDLTASLRGGHVGKKVAVYGSGGVGFAYVRLGEPGGFGVYPEPVGATWAPVLTAAGSLETPAHRHSRFVFELRYSWIEADLGAGAGGSLNAGGAMMLFGWRGVF